MPSKNLKLFKEGGEGDAYFERNPTPITPKAAKIMSQYIGKDKTVLEIGCSAGHFLNYLPGKDKCGIDPSTEAIRVGREKFPGLELKVGTADKIPFKRKFDRVIFGFCLYLVDRDCLAKVFKEANRLLKNGGSLIIYDFAHEGDLTEVPYEHLKGVTSYHEDYRPYFKKPDWELRFYWETGENVVEGWIKR